MSKESWDEKYYPVDAHRVADKDAGAAILQKWVGLNEKILDEHGLYKVPDNIRIMEDKSSSNAPSFSVGTDTCPWCLIDMRDRELYFKAEGVSRGIRSVDEIELCDFCPAVLAGMPTCIDDTDGVSNAPYHYWTETGDTGPMRDWIRRAIKAIDDKEKGA